MKKIIHTLFVLDKSFSMMTHRGRTIESLNSNLASLKREATENDVTILNTLLTFSSGNNQWIRGRVVEETGWFEFVRTAENVLDSKEITEKDYLPDGGTPLLDAIGNGIEKLKQVIGDGLGNDDLHIIVNIFTDGEENSSKVYKKADIKKMIDHLSGDGKWTFAFVGCGSFEDVSDVSSGLGIAACNTLSYAATPDGVTDAYNKVATFYTTSTRSIVKGEKVKGFQDA